MDRHHRLLDELRAPTRSLRHSMPDGWAAFLQLHAATMADGTLPARMKEEIALAISVVKRCDGCIAHHARAAVRAGATPEEVSEVLAVTLLMDGATASVYAPLAWEAFEAFRADTAEERSSDR